MLKTSFISGLGFVVVLVSGVLLIATVTCLSRRAAVARRKNKFKRDRSYAEKLYSLVHLPSVGRLAEIVEIHNRFDNWVIKAKMYTAAEKGLINVFNLI